MCDKQPSITQYDFEILLATNNDYILMYDHLVSQNFNIYLKKWHSFVSRNIGMIKKYVIYFLTCSNLPWTSSFTRGESARTKTYSPIKYFIACYKNVLSHYLDN